MDECDVVNAIEDFIIELSSEDGYLGDARLALIGVLRKWKEGPCE